MQTLYAYRLRRRLERIGRAWRYATGRATRGDALTLIYEAEQIAEVYSLAGFSAGDVIEDAAEEFEDTPELREVCSNAAARVAQKWSDSGDTASAAQDWALDLVREWAAERGLVRLPEDNEIAA